MREPFRWSRGHLKQMESGTRLWQHWVGTGGFAIWQGRPYPDPKQFIYSLELPDGTFEEFEYLNDAKRRGRTLSEAS